MLTSLGVLDCWLAGGGAGLGWVGKLLGLGYFGEVSAGFGLETTHVDSNLSLHAN